MYSGDWRFYNAASYATPAGPQSTPTIVFGRDVGSCSYGCTLSEDVGFEVEEKLVRQIAQSYLSEPQKPWRFKFEAQSGWETINYLMPAEVAGALMAVDQYRKAHPIPTSGTSISGPARQKAGPSKKKGA